MATRTPPDAKRRRTRRNLTVIKHSAAVAMAAQLDLVQRKGWTVLLQHAYRELASRDRHEIRVAEFIDRLGLNTENYEYIRQVLKALTTTTVTWNILRKDKARWGATTLLAGAEISDGTITYEFSTFLREHLYEPRMYARYALAMLSVLTSKHSMTLFELIVDYEWTRQDDRYGVVETPVMDLAQFRDLMGVGAEAYARWSDLRRYVIEPAVDEVNAVSTYEIEYRAIREGRKIAKIQFFGRSIRGKGMQLPMALA